MQKSDEREFLHTIATPLGTAILLADSLKEGSTMQNQVSAEMTAQLDSLIKTLEVMRQAVRARQESIPKTFK